MAATAAASSRASRRSRSHGRSPRRRTSLLPACRLITARRSICPGWEERQHAIGEATKKARETRDVLARHKIEWPTITGAGTGTFEFEAASSVYTELQSGSYIFMDADYSRNLDRGGAPTKAFERAFSCGRR
jgi:hypothetical protein